MKWVGLLIILAAIEPIANWLRRNPDAVPKVWVIFGFLPFALSFIHLYMAFISWLDWPGYVKGTEITVIDALAIALYRSSSGPAQPLPFKLSIGIYLFATVISAFQAEEPTATLFYSLQVARMFLVYAAVARGCATDSRVPVAVLTGMTFALFVEGSVTVWQRVIVGMVQAPGTMYHQNLLGMMTHFVALPAFALMLSGRAGRVLNAAAPVGVAIDILTTSRGALGFSLLGYALIFVFSSLRGWTPRKRQVLSGAVLAALLLVPVAVSSFDQRFADQADLIASDYDERAAFEKAAGLMLSDNPLGQGANHYVISANLRGYNSRAGVISVMESQAANVHNVYLLVAAETGYPGLIAFLIMLLRPMIVALLCGWRTRGDRRGDLLIGLGVALLIVYAHGFFEWIFVLSETEYLFAMDFGLVAGLAMQLGYWSRPAFEPVSAREDHVSIVPEPSTMAPARSARRHALR